MEMFTDKIMLVVGGACGMGAATVTQLVRRGAHVVVLDLNQEAMEELIEDEDLLSGPGTLDVVYGDVNDAAVRDAAIGIVKDKYGTLDSLLYIAGVQDLSCPVHNTDDELYDYVMGVNVNSAFRIVRDTLPMLRNHEGEAANIIFVCSTGSLYASGSGAAYAVSKHALLGLAKNLAWSYHFDNVRVNSVLPGATATDIMANAAEKWPDRPLFDEEGDQLFSKMSIVSLCHDREGNLLMGEPEDIANAIMFLLSPASHAINGAQIKVDNGWTTF